MLSLPQSTLTEPERDQTSPSLLLTSGSQQERCKTKAPQTHLSRRTFAERPSSNCSGQFNRFDVECLWPEQATVENRRLSNPVLLVRLGTLEGPCLKNPSQGYLDGVEGLDWGAEQTIVARESLPQN